MATATETTEFVQVFPAEENKQSDRVVSIDRISRTVKGGRRIRFRALVIVGNHNGQVGIGVAKANDVQTAIASARTACAFQMVRDRCVRIARIQHAMTQC
jgi:small subunit ribosomal protein S5